MGSMSIMHWAIVAGVVALLFGRGKISGLMEEMALGIKSFKNGMKDDAAESEQTSKTTAPPADHLQLATASATAERTNTLK